MPKPTLGRTAGNPTGIQLTAATDDDQCVLRPGIGHIALAYQVQLSTVRCRGPSKGPIRIGRELAEVIFQPVR